MVPIIFKIGLSAVVLFAVVFQVFFKDIICRLAAIGVEMQPLTDFPFKCRKIEHARLEACEDMWLSENTRQLFLACSDPLARQHWSPASGMLDASRKSTKDAFVVLNIDEPRGSSFAFRELTTPGFTGTGGDGFLSVLGFSASEHGDTIQILMTQNGPSLDAETGALLDQQRTGANVTVELFETGRSATELKHVRTYAHQHIATPNRVALLPDGSFYLTNDHGPYKTGLKYHISPLIRSGDVSFCTKGGDCRIVARDFMFPNGLALGKDGLLYVPDTLEGTITIFRILENRDLEKIAVVPTQYPPDNIAIDGNGNIYVAALPKATAMYKLFADPYNAKAPGAAYKMSHNGTDYVIDKVIEDAHGEILPFTTTVVHDAKTGRLFFSSVLSPFITVCEPMS